MKQISIVILFVLNSLGAYAWQAHSQVIVGPKGEFQDSVTLYCRPDETLCFQVCGDSNACTKEQELCYNCLGTYNPLLKTVFTEIERLYRNTGRIVGPTTTANVFKADHIFVSAKSIYNFYTPVDAEVIQQRFQELCPTQSASPIVVMGKNGYNEPNSIKYIICEGQGPFNQDMAILEYSPQVINKTSINYINP